MFATSLIIIFLAALASVIFGALWYMPKVFGDMWMSSENFTPEMRERGMKRMPLVIFLNLLSGMLIAYVMWYFAVAWGVYDWAGAFQLAFWIWIGFVTPVLLGWLLWDQKSFKVFLVHEFHWLIKLIIIALVIVYGAQLFIFGALS